MTTIVRDRDRALGPHPGRPAGGRDRHPRRSSRSSPWSRSTPATPARRAIHPSLSWFNPFSLSPSEISAGMLLAVFIYWGWDTTATVNEETEDPGEAPGRATVISTLILLGIYLVVAVAAQSYAGVDGLIDEPGRRAQPLGAEVFGSPLDKILIIAVLTSAAASTQTTILPTARTTLSMARAHAMPESLGKVHPRYLTPHVSTILMGVALDRLVRRPDPGQRRHPLRLARGARPDDRLLHRPHRLRLHDLLPPRAAAQRQELLLHRRRPDLRRRRSSSTCWSRTGSNSPTRPTPNRATPGSGSARRW